MRFGIHLHRTEFGGMRVRGWWLGDRGLFPLGDQFDDKNNEQDQGNARAAHQQFIQIARRAVQPKKQRVPPSNETMPMRNP